MHGVERCKGIVLSRARRESTFSEVDMQVKTATVVFDPLKREGLVYFLSTRYAHY